MKHILSLALCAGIFFMLATQATALQTVNSLGGADWDTITSATAASAADEEVRIVGGGPYAEDIFIDGGRSLTP